MKERMATMKKDDDFIAVWRKNMGRCPICKDSDRLLVFLFSYFIFVLNVLLWTKLI